MSARRAAWVSAFLLAVGACTFAPDLSRFAACDASGGCPSGTTCLASENRCLPACGEGRTCDEPGPEGDDDAGTDTDAGVTTDAGTTDGGDLPDAGPAALALESTLLTEGIETLPYSASLQARGGTPPYTFNATGQLPAGFSLDTEGRLTGTPTRAGDAFLPVEVTDQGTPMKRASGNLLLRIRPLLRLAGPGPLADVPENRAYSERLSATGGQPPYRFALTSGQSLPAGLTLSDDGSVTGTTAQQGTQDFRVEVTDSATPPQTASRVLTLTTVDAPGFVKCLSRAVPDGRVGTEYSYTLKTVGGSGTFAWSVKSGELPPGIVLDTQQGILSGTPTRADTFTFVIGIGDLLTSTQQTFSLKVD
ncbi:putative Ig domain-containing protein [Corallococcus llansteffanensis]|uniref:Hemagglutinin n=1 Tax=Corallococcus llansteffanensis TaxID=2316731 RepID=A0A3A8QDF6_9BACT|nr:putative Ig domain-containing protein [Corallococcus llansteffanensis]RKH64315.1 hemagglutinin [Corallococcus llansteffanensis]